MTTFLIKYHIYQNDIKFSQFITVTFKWWEWISVKRIMKKFFKHLQKENIKFPVYSHDIDSIELIF